MNGMKREDVQLHPQHTFCTGSQRPSGYVSAGNSCYLDCLCPFLSSQAHGLGFYIAIPEICWNTPSSTKIPERCSKRCTTSFFPKILPTFPLLVMDQMFHQTCLAGRLQDVEANGSFTVSYFLEFLQSLQGTPYFCHLVVFSVVLYSYLLKPQSEVIPLLSIYHSCLAWQLQCRHIIYDPPLTPPNNCKLLKGLYLIHGWSHQLSVFHTVGIQGWLNKV